MKFLISTIIALFFSQTPVWAQISDEEELLEPEKAFALEAKIIDGKTLRAEWTIAKGYYLYREKFKFESDQSGITLGSASFPKGKIKKDEFFGTVETYRNKVTIDIPIQRAAGSPDKFLLKTVSQGCADMGVCYPPLKQQVSLTLPAAAPATSTSSGNAFGALKSLGQSLGLGANDDEFLEADQAFIFSASVVDAHNIKVRWDIAKGYYLYREKFKFELTDAAGNRLGQAQFPTGEFKTDESFGRMEVYHNSVEAIIPVVRDNLEKSTITLKAKYQGCAEAGFCYPPMDQTMPLTLAKTDKAQGATPAISDSGVPLSEQDSIAQSLASGNTLWTLLTFFGFGLLLSFTPCVFPMIPILSSIIVGQGEGITTRRSFTMSLVYVLAMAVTYTIAGIVAGLWGANLQAMFQNPWILGTFSAVFVLLSLSMFGFYDLQMPASWQSKLTEISNRQQGGTLIGVGIMGFLSALIVGPCVAAPLMGALIYIGQTGDAVLGGMALFSLSLGMGAPLLAIGTSAGKLLPRAGGWMETIKAVFGVMLIAVAIWMIERIVPTAVTMSLWAALLIITSIYMGALSHLDVDATGVTKFLKGVGLIMLVYGILLLVGVASGGKEILQPLRGGALMAGGSTSGAAIAQTSGPQFKKVKSLAQLRSEIQKANAQGKPVMADYYADWCISCKEMEKYTFSDANVQREMAQGVLIKVDVTDNDDDAKQLLKEFKLIGPPAMIFFDRQGNERREFRLVGFLAADKFSAHVNKAFQ